jgi:TetR/AcrR family transcriptional repressor of bet genes
MARPSNKKERRLQIVQGLMSTMATSGYNGATIPQIARAVGLTPGLVHYHFANKQEILIELIHYLTGLVSARCKTTEADLPAARLADYINAHLALGEGTNADAVACWITIGAEAVNQPELRAAFQRATAQQVESLEKICEAALTEAGRPTAKKREMALGIIAAIEGSYRLIIGAPDMIPHGFAAPTVRLMAEGFITAQ